ncbi:hypothetical protein GUJ93_ZPchr0005g14886 [Zizania palustris]|uniref:DUF1618 domain-containing protein n=1 Tax=Zizania palustris TaxID=103762 RepID=A0A8J5SXK3_ZIZPA|nr:hypothetical protein GUJ93_ZPchr0005g14886 [Zizania palustris]
MSGKTEVFPQCEKMVSRPDEILVLTLMQRPWSILTSSILLQQKDCLRLGNDGVRMFWGGHPPKTTVVYFDANEQGNVDAEYCYVSAVDLTSGDFLICAGYKLKKRARKTSYVPRTTRRQWNGNGVIAHGRRLFLTDLSDGLLMCDLFSFSPRIKLQFIPLPQGCELAEGTASDLITKRRFVNVSCGMLRFVHMEDRGPDKTPVVKLWTLNDLPDGDGITWRHEYTLNFRTIWEHQSFRAATGLQGGAPFRWAHPPLEV